MMDLENVKGLHFRFLENLSEIEDILKRRLPKSANVSNLSRVYDNFKKPDELAFYVLNLAEDDNCQERFKEENCWILAGYFREDYGMRYCISAPINPIINKEVTDAFINCPYINWHERYHFACLTFDINQLIWEISTKVFGNSVSSMPCRIYTIERDQALKLELVMPEEDMSTSNLTLKPLDPIKGAEFISSTWKYSLGEETTLAVRKLLEKNKSVGLYAKNEVGGEDQEQIICGMLINDGGLMGMLYSLPEHRGKGYAMLVAKKLIKSFAEEHGAMPCSAVEMRNEKSIAFHEKLGMKCTHYADFIKYVPQSWK